MAERSAKKRAERIQCHFISNTHWDREWRYSAQRIRHMLVHLLDMLFDILEKEPRFKHFHLDSQTLPVQDYLEVRPEMEETFRKHVTDGKIAIGPWFCLPDEFCVSGESLIRNLLLGHKIAKKMGKVSKTGYSPFGWGQISQMPQIYQGFGIDVISFYRGVNSIVAPNSEFYWEGPDGTRIIGSRLARRPRYNVWYVIQRPLYWNWEDEDDRMVSWKNGRAPFRFIHADDRNVDYQYAHPEFGYYDECIPARARQAIEEQDGEWTTPHRFWSAGHDSSCPDIREVRMIADCDAALEDADVFHSTIEDWQNGLRQNQQSSWPLLKGEMRHTYTEGSSSPLYGWISSTRMYLKQDNFRTEQAITTYAEPAAVFASLLGAQYPQGFIDIAYNWLLQNHGHDCIGACSRDIVHDDMQFRNRQSREISLCVFERAMLDIVGAVDLSKYSTEDMALVVYNAAPFQRSEVMQAYIDVPAEWNCVNIELVDEKNKPVPLQVLDSGPFNAGIIQSPNDCANCMPATRYHVRAWFDKIPGMGYRTFFVKPVMDKRIEQPRTMCTGPQTMENDFIRVSINSNGTLDVLDKKSDRLMAGMGYFRDSGEVGNPWEHFAPQNDQVFTTLNENARITRITDGLLEASFRVEIDWALPEGRTADDKARSEVLRVVPIVNTVTLRKGEPWVEIVSDIDNTVEDHYLQVIFPTGVKTDKVMAQGQFDVVRRPITTPDFTQFDDIPQSEQVMNSFVDLSDGTSGAALLNEGLKAYEAVDDDCRTVGLTMLRAYPLRICVTQEMTDYSQQEKGSQCLGRNSYRYAIMPHKGDWEAGKVWQAAERFTIGLRAAQIGPTDYGTEPLSRSFLELDNDNLHISAIKRSETGKGWVVRLFNPFDKTVRTKLRLNGGRSGPNAMSPVERIQAACTLPRGKGRKWRKVREVSLEEIAQDNISTDADGWVKIVLTKKKILTIEFLE